MPGLGADDLRLIVDLTFWWVSPQSRAVIHHLLSTGGALASADALARKLGMANRHHLAYVLRRDGLHPPAEIAAWVKLTIWTAEWETHGHSLCSVTLSEGRDPATRYRLVRRLTGTGWKQVRERGVLWVIELWRRRCEQPGLAHTSYRRSASR